MRLVLEAPALPQPAVSEFFRELLRAGPEWAHVALSTTLNVINQRGPDRSAPPLDLRGRAKPYRVPPYRVPPACAALPGCRAGGWSWPEP